MNWMKTIKEYRLLFIIAAVAVIFPSLAVGNAGKPEPISVDLYVMSQCPFGTKAEDVFIPAVRSLGPLAALNIHFIGGETPGEAGKPSFTSMHGFQEVVENQRHLCAMKNFPKEAFDFILERNKNIHDANWQNAAKKVGIDPAKLDACVTGAEGAKLLSDSFKVSQSRSASASPTIDINGMPYSGARGLRSITLAICDALGSKGLSLPDACEKAKNMPPDPAPSAGCEDKAAGGAGAAKPAVIFDVQVLTDKNCSFCEPTLLDSIKRQHTGANIKMVDVNSDEGKALVKKHDVRITPYYFLDKKVEQDTNFSSMKGYYAKTGGGYAVIPGPDTYAPAVQLNRRKVPHQLDLFVESNSPFTAQVEAQLVKFLVESDVKDLTFSIHYIVQETAKVGEDVSATGASSKGVRAASLRQELGAVAAGPLTSRRGEAELQESMRQVCLFQHAPVATFFTYLGCRNQNILDADRGNTCLEMNDAISKCIQGPEAESLLRQDAKLVQDLGITSGPVFLWENRYGPFGWYQVDWKKIITEQEK